MRHYTNSLLMPDFAKVLECEIPINRTNYTFSTKTLSAFIYKRSKKWEKYTKGIGTIVWEDSSLKIKFMTIFFSANDILEFWMNLKKKFPIIKFDSSKFKKLSEASKEKNITGE